ncbi:MAG: response regulator [Cyanobacteria bacterium P01_A01_bin.3]
MRFLVVDDSAVDRRLLTSMLEDLGHQADNCHTPEGALDKVTCGAYDAVFLDIVMPGQDGYKFLRSLRANPPTASQRVILYSNKKTPLEVNYGLQRAGANHYLTKPVTRESLTAVLTKI